MSSSTPPPLPPQNRLVTLLIGMAVANFVGGSALFRRDQAERDLQRSQRGIVHNRSSSGDSSIIINSRSEINLDGPLLAARKRELITSAHPSVNLRLGLNGPWG